MDMDIPQTWDERVTGSVDPLASRKALGLLRVEDLNDEAFVDENRAYPWLAACSVDEQHVSHHQIDSR